MPFYLFIWNDEIEEHIAEHGITPEEFEEVVCDPDEVARAVPLGRFPVEIPVLHLRDGAAGGGENRHAGVLPGEIDRSGVEQHDMVAFAGDGADHQR